MINKNLYKEKVDKKEISCTLLKIQETKFIQSELILGLYQRLSLVRSSR